MTERDGTSGTASTAVPDLIAGRVERHPDHMALVVDGEHRLTLGEWQRRARSVAHGLLDRGVRHGDRVALLADDAGWIDFAVANVAVYLAGGTAVGMSRRLSDADLQHRMAECRTVGLLYSGGVEAPPHDGWSSPVPAAGPGESGPLPVTVSGDDVAEILYTSGTTGPPKPVAVTHANLTFGRDTSGELFGGIDSILCAVPVATNAGHSALIVALTTGSTAHVLSAVGPEEIARVVEKLRIEHAILTPGDALGMVSSGVLDRHDLSSVRTLMFGSAAVPLAAVGLLSRALPDAKIMIGYGSTESAPAFTRLALDPWNDHNDPDFYRRQPSALLGSPGGGTDVMIVDEAGTSVPTGELGEVCLRSEAPRRRYVGSAAAQSDVGRAGWTRMGDLGHLDEDGRLHFFDRKADVITRRGAAVSSVRVETALLWHPAVAQAAAFGVLDPAAGEIVIVAVESGEDVDVDELADFLNGRLEQAERPDRIIAVDALPRGATGKVLKRRLRERFATALAV